MADYLNNAPAGDEYSDALTLGPDFATNKATITVANNPAFIQVAQGVPGDWQWTDEREFFSIAQSFTIGGIIGIRFRNAVAGQVAQIMCTLSGPADPDFGAGSPFNATVSPDGSVSASGPIVTEIVATGAGNFTIPPGVKIVRVMCVGAGGGGGGGHKSGSTGTGGGGGGGGGGGALSIVEYTAAELLALYPTGIVPYTVGAGGLGGGVDIAGGNGGATTFGAQSAGGGGGGSAGSASNNTITPGSGGAVTSAALYTPGNPRAAQGTAVGIQGGTAQSTGTQQFGTEYGGAAGGARSNGAAVGTANPGFAGGNSMWGGPGGGGGASSTLAAVQKGGEGGLTGSIAPSSAVGTGANANGTQTGPWCGSGGDGGDSSTTAAGGAPAAMSGGSGSIGAGGGGGGGACLAAAGGGGAGGNGSLTVVVF